jgi:regulator of replication initiation timing
MSVLGDAIVTLQKYEAALNKATEVIDKLIAKCKELKTENTVLKAQNVVLTRKLNVISTVINGVNNDEPEQSEA